MTRNRLLKNNAGWSVIATVFIVAAISGCKKQQPPAPPQPQQAKPVAQQQKPAIQKPASSATLLSATPEQSFDFSGKKDPFKPFVIEKPVVPGAKQVKNALPIHSFDVNQFKVIGIVVGGKENKAMVVDPKGKGYVLKVGMTIGKNNGRVTAITANSVNVVEQFRDENGKIRKENITISLPRKQ